MMELSMLCPRRDESHLGSAFPGPDEWDQRDDTCSYCGSLNPDTLMARIEAGDVELGPTDKSYKVYVHNAGGEKFKQAYRGCPPSSGCKDPDDCQHWVVRDMEQTKFYFRHLSEAQMRRFVDLLNEKKLKVGYPGYFYAKPFFIR